MSDLWIYGRRPAGVTRHRHGGFNAAFPMNFHTVEEQAGLMRAAAAEAARMARIAPLVESIRRDGFEAQNVIRLQPRASRVERAAKKPRHTLRKTPC